MKINTMKTKILNRTLMVFMLGVALLVVTGCKLSTPEIRGIVLDEETGEPVSDAWITSSVTVKGITGSTSVLSVAPPHLRTGEDGTFVVPSRGVSRSFSGAKVLSFGVSATTADWRGGGVELKDRLRKRGVEVIIYAKSSEKFYRDFYSKRDDITKQRVVELIELEQFSALQSTYTYCQTGRLSVMRPSVEGGCDAWELDYVIEKHERFLERLGEIKTTDQKTHYSGTIGRLARLYKKKGDYKKALMIFRKAKSFDEQHYQPPIPWHKNYETQIKELEGLLAQ